MLILHPLSMGKWPSYHEISGQRSNHQMLHVEQPTLYMYPTLASFWCCHNYHFMNTRRMVAWTMNKLTKQCLHSNYPMNVLYLYTCTYVMLAGWPLTSGQVLVWRHNWSWAWPLHASNKTGLQHTCMSLSCDSHTENTLFHFFSCAE